MSIEAMKLAFEKMTGIVGAWELPALMQSRNGFIQGWEAAVEQAQKPTTWVSKEQLLQDWLPRLWDALKDVRHKENAAAEETLYELYVEMKQETIAEKLDTMSHITPEDQLSAVIAELQVTQKRLADTENILCRQHFEQAEQEPDYVAAPYSSIPGERVSKPVAYFKHPPQRQWVGLTHEEKLELWLKTESEKADRYASGFVNAEVDRYAFVDAVEAKLREKNT